MPTLLLVKRPSPPIISEDGKRKASEPLSSRPVVGHRQQRSPDTLALRFPRDRKNGYITMGFISEIVTPRVQEHDADQAKRCQFGAKEDGTWRWVCKSIGEGCTLAIGDLSRFTRCRAEGCKAIRQGEDRFLIAWDGRANCDGGHDVGRRGPVKLERGGAA